MRKRPVTNQSRIKKLEDDLVKMGLSFNKIAQSNLVLAQIISEQGAVLKHCLVTIDLLLEKGILNQEELSQRIEKLDKENNNDQENTNIKESQNSVH